MASGNTIADWTALNNEPPSSAYATNDVRNNHNVLDFDQSTIEGSNFRKVLPRHYSSGNIVAYIHYSATGITTGDVVWGVSFERISDSQQDIDADGFATEQTVTTTVPGTDGHVKIASLTITAGANTDNIAAGELFRVRVRRVANDGADTAAADAEFHALELKEA